jgi:hypothetical protein
MARLNSTPIISSQDMLQAAVALAERGFWVRPCAGPIRAGAAAPKTTRGMTLAKRPLPPHGIKDSSKQVADIFNWWHKWPRANIAIDLQKSGLLVIAPDSLEWLVTILTGLPPTPVVAQSGGGEGHYHFYYRRPEGCPIWRVNEPDKYDIQTGGYMVAPPSLHQSGRRYQWVSYVEAVGGAR